MNHHASTIYEILGIANLRFWILDFGLSRVFGKCAEAVSWKKSGIINLKCPEQRTLALVLIQKTLLRR
ncbi:hypothetical protein H6H01_03140 [Nostoc calcicola FACHB-3891]|nr:hypothetical protein [Nostoc calcicola FACHB-3891]